MKQLAKRALNELPTAVVLGLTIAGVDQTDYAPLVEFAGAVGTFGTWLLVRLNTDGPVTAIEREKRVKQGMRNIRRKQRR